MQSSPRRYRRMQSATHADKGTLMTWGQTRSGQPDPEKAVGASCRSFEAASPRSRVTAAGALIILCAFSRCFTVAESALQPAQSPPACIDIRWRFDARASRVAGSHSPSWPTTMLLRGGMPKRNLDDQYEEEAPGFERASEETMRARRVIRVRGKTRTTYGSGESRGSDRPQSAPSPSSQFSFGLAPGAGALGYGNRGQGLGNSGAGTVGGGSQGVECVSAPDAHSMCVPGEENPEMGKIEGLQKEYQAWANDFVTQTAALNKDLVSQQRAIWDTLQPPPSHVNEALEFLCSNTSIFESMHRLTDHIQELENTLREETNSLRLENEALRRELMAANEKLTAAAAGNVAVAGEGLGNHVAKQEEVDSDGRAARALAMGGKDERHMSEGLQAGQMSEGLQAGHRCRAFSHEEDLSHTKSSLVSMNTKGSPVHMNSAVSVAEPPDASKGGSLSVFPKAEGGRRANTRSVVVRGLCQNATEEAIASFFREASRNDSGGDEVGTVCHGVKNVRLLAWNSKYPSRMAYVNFASAGALRAALKLDGAVPVWNAGAPLHILQQDAPGEVSPHAQRGVGMAAGGVAGVGREQQDARQQDAVGHVSQGVGQVSAGSTLPAHPVTPMPVSRQLAPHETLESKDGPMATSSLFGLNALTPQPAVPFVSPFSRPQPSSGREDTSLWPSPLKTFPTLAPSTGTPIPAAANPESKPLADAGAGGPGAAGARGGGEAQNSDGQNSSAWLGVKTTSHSGSKQAVAADVAANSSAAAPPSFPASPLTSAPNPFLQGFMRSASNASGSPGMGLGINNPFLKVFGDRPAGSGAGGGLLGSLQAPGSIWGLDSNRTSMFQALAPSGSLASGALANPFFPAPGAAGRAVQEDEEDDAKDAAEAEREVAVDPDAAVYKADKVEVKTGEEEEETLFTLAKAKLFEYQKAEGDAAGAGNWSVKGIGRLRLNKYVGNSDGPREQGKQGEDEDVAQDAGGVRVVMRKMGNLELILNSRLFAGMACKKGGEKAVIFSGMREEGLVTFLVRTSTPAEADALHQQLIQYCPKA